MNRTFARRIVLLLTALAVVAGCATHQINWSARVGTYTYDQAIIDLGPPDKTAKLTTGQTVAEWISRYSYGGTTTVVGGGYYGNPVGVGVIHNPPAYRESKLRLTFSTNNILTNWVKS
jgi:hypothetical protein